MVFVGHPEHAVFDWTVFDAGGRAGASGAALSDDGEFFGLFLARGGEAFGLRFELEFVGNHPDSFGRSGCGRHGRDYSAENRFWLLASVVGYFDCGLRGPAVEKQVPRAEKKALGMTKIKIKHDS